MKIPNLRHPASRRLCALSAVIVASFAHAVSAGTLAHWRFDEGAVDASVEPPREDVVRDSSGNGNHLRTWDENSAPTYTAETPFDRAPQTDSSNDYALRFEGRKDIYSEDKPINTHEFDAITLEASFMTADAGATQAILGKDGYQNPEEHGAQPIALKIVSGRMELLITDGAGNLVAIQSEEPIESDVWYQVAATATSAEASLWLKRPGDSEYNHEATVPIEGLFVVEDGTWSAGRGMWRGEGDNHFNGIIDEIRISDSALEPDQFLGVPPDPSIGRGTLLELSQLDTGRRTDPGAY